MTALDLSFPVASEHGCACWANTYALGHEGHCCFVREDRNRRIDNGFKAVEDICHVPAHRLAPADPRSWAVSVMNSAELAAFAAQLEVIRDYALEVIAGREDGWTVNAAWARHDRAQLALADLVDRGVI